MIFVTVSTGHFDPLIRACDNHKDQYEFVGQIGSGFYIPSFPWFRICPPDELVRHMDQAEIVISHGGTGMLSMLYRLKKRAIVIPKQVRYGEANDSQVELAEEWARLGMAVLCMDVVHLSSAVQECRKKIFHYPVYRRLGDEILQELTQKALTPLLEVPKSPLSSKSLER